MGPPDAADRAAAEQGELEFFGARLKVRHPRLAALLSSVVEEDVRVVGRVAPSALSADGGESQPESVPPASG